jgi:glycosyltransferase involved in cell wall biosynthesis
MRTQDQRKLTIIVPCFNERRTILELIARVKRLPIDKTVLVIDDASTDGTRELLRAVCSNERTAPRGRPWSTGQRVMDGDGFTVVLQPRNFAKGTCIKLGIALAESEYVVCQDADLEYDPADIVRLLEYADRTGAPAVFGSRLLERRRLPMNAFHVGRVALTKAFRVLYASPITDVATCYKLIRADVARSLELEAAGFDLDFEIAAKLRRHKYAIAELSVSYRPRSRSEGKKIRWRDGLSAIWTLFRVRLAWFGAPAATLRSP